MTHGTLESEVAATSSLSPLTCMGVKLPLAIAAV